MSIGVFLSITFGFFLLHLYESASRSIGWIVFSGCIALMLFPALNLLDKFLPRGIGVLVLVLFVATLISLPAYTVVDNVNRQSDKLEKTLPDRAAQLESEGRFAKSFQEFELEKKTRSAIKGVPETLQGGSRAEQIKANADRAIAFVAGGVLMIFFLLYGNKLVIGALSVIKEEKNRDETKQLLLRAYTRATLFGWSQIGLSVSAGVATYGICRISEIPAAGLLGVWVALWNIVPVFGVIIGSLPVVVLAGAQSPRLALLLLLFFVTYETLESVVRYKLLGHKALRIDSIVTILVVFGGLELYGLGGALAGLVIASFLHALAGEIARTRPPNYREAIPSQSDI
jgi:predicted PurR-regulated permease PerM